MDVFDAPTQNGTDEDSAVYLTPTTDFSNTSTVELIEIEGSESGGETRTPPHAQDSRTTPASRLRVDDRSTKSRAPSPSILRTAHDEQLEYKYFSDDILHMEGLNQRTASDGHVRSESHVFINQHIPASDRRSVITPRTSTSVDAHAESDDTASNIISVSRGKGGEGSSRGEGPKVFGRPGTESGGGRAGRGGTSNSTVESRNAFHGNARTPATFRLPTSNTSLRSPGSPNKMTAKVNDASHPRDGKKSPEAGRRKSQRVSAGDVSDEDRPRKSQRDRNKTLPSVKEVLTDRLNSQLNIDNHERFRRERSGAGGSQQAAPTDAASACENRGGPMMMWIKGGTLSGSKDGAGTEVARSAPGADGSATGARTERSRTSSRTPGEGDPPRRPPKEEDVKVEVMAASPVHRTDAAPGGGNAGVRVTCKPEDLGAVGGPTNENQVLRYSMRGAATAPWERHTRGFGSRILRGMGFDGTTGARETEIVTSFASVATAAISARGGSQGGLGYLRPAGGEASARPCPSAPCEVDLRRRRSDPSPAYSGVTVHFPFEAPMKPQSQVMQRIIAGLKSKRHALLESPTGTGKSAAILCSTLAWQRAELVTKQKAPQIIYGARTHTQLAQMAAELRKSPYRPTMAILGSRKQLCMHPSVVGDVPSTAGGGPDDEGEQEYVPVHTQHVGGGVRARVAPGGWGATAVLPETQAGVKRASGRRGASERPGTTTRQPPKSLASMQDTCQALRSRVERDRNIRRLRYNDDAPDLRRDLAAMNLGGAAQREVGAGCPFYRAMSTSEYSKLTHEVTRPAVGLANGYDGIWDLEDLRGFGRDPRGFMARKRQDWYRALAASRGENDARSVVPSQASPPGPPQDGPRDEARPAAVAPGVSCGSGPCGCGGESEGSSSVAAGTSRSRAREVIDLSYESDEDAGGDPGCAGDVASGGQRMSVEPGGALEATRAVQAAAGKYYGFGGERGGARGLRQEGGRGDESDAEGEAETAVDQALGPDDQLVGCPYYTAQALAQRAQLLLVPYNYILDPQIRKALTVPVADNVVVLDEGHNIESVCRDAGSLELSVVTLSRVALSLAHLAMSDSFCANAAPLLDFVKHLTRFAAQQSRTLGDFETGRACGLPRGTPEEERRLKGQLESVREKWAFDSAGTNFWKDLTRGTKFTHHALTTALTDLQATIREVLQDASDLSLGHLESFFFVADLMLRRPHDYNINLIAWDNVTHTPLPARCEHRQRECGLEEWEFLARHPDTAPARLFQLNIWLMAPDVVFNDVAEQAHSVILTSGTLSPLDSMKGELGQAFEKRLLPYPQQALEADHVVTPGHQLQVFAVGYTPPPHSIDLTCTKRNLDDKNFMQQLGRTVASLCRHIPSGVLVFLPSYTCLRSAVRAWQRSQVWFALTQAKSTIVIEPESIAEFKAAKRRYEEAIDVPGGGRALLLAVYRGKMSEGISFNDRYARGVLCVGIPYPSAVDPKVKAKKSYNDWKAKARGWNQEDPLKHRGRGGGRQWSEIVRAAREALEGLGDTEEGTAGVAGASEADADAVAGEGRATLSGDMWHKQQAFRALNQALGRCIRHIYDYGVICLLDSRHDDTNSPAVGHSKYLSRWMRGLVFSPPSLERMLRMMDELFASAPDYVERRKAEAKQARLAAARARRPQTSKARPGSAGVAAVGTTGDPKASAEKKPTAFVADSPGDLGSSGCGRCSGGMGPRHAGDGGPGASLAAKGHGRGSGANEPEASPACCVGRSEINRGQAYLAADGQLKSTSYTRGDGAEARGLTEGSSRHWAKRETE